MAKRDYKAELEALLDYTAEHPEMARYVNREAVMMALIRFFQGACHVGLSH